MNSAILSLFKVNIKQTFDYRGKNKKNVAFFVPILLILLLGCLLSGMYSLIFGLMVKELGGDLSIVVYAMAGIASMMILSTTVPKVKTTIFGSKDYEMLASLPIRKSHIIAVKFLSLYFSELLFSFALVIPATLISILLQGSPILLIDGFLLFLFIPLAPLIIASFVGMLIGFIADRFKFGNIITVLFYMVFLMVVMYVSFTFSSANATEDYTEAIQSLSYMIWLNPSTKILSLDLPVLNYVLYLVIHLGVFVLLSVILACCYDYFHILMTATKSHQKYVEKEIKPKGQFKALLHVDLKRYFSSKAYLLNTITGGVLSVVLVIMMVVIFFRIDDPEAVTILKTQVAPYLPIMILWCSSLAIPSSVSITMEGKCFWQCKVLPIDYRQYSYSKIVLSEIIIAPFILVASIVLLFFMDITPMNVITTLVLPQLYFFTMNCFAYFINMHYYNFKWENETKAAKSGASPLVAMLFDFIGSIGVTIIFVALGILVNYLIGAIISMLICLGMGVFVFTLIRNKSEELLSKIEF